MVAWIRSHHFYLQWKFKLRAGKFAWGVKAKHCLQTFWIQKFVDNIQQYFAFTPFPLIIWIFTEGELDGIKSGLFPSIFFTLYNYLFRLRGIFVWWWVICEADLRIGKFDRTKLGHSHSSVHMDRMSQYWILCWKIHTGSVDKK